MVLLGGTQDTGHRTQDSARVCLLIAVVLLSFSCTGPKERDFRERFKEATAREDNGEYWQAIGSYRALLRNELADNDRINVLFRLGDCYRKTGNHTLGEQAYREVARDYSKEIYLELAYGRLVDCYREAGRYRDALAVYPQLIEVTGEDILLANVYYDLGRVYAKLRQERAARRAYRGAIARCRAVQEKHAGGDFASYASQIEEEVREAISKLR